MVKERTVGNLGNCKQRLVCLYERTFNKSEVLVSKMRFFFLFNNIVITFLLVFFDVAYFMSVAVLLLVGFVDLVMALLWLHELSRK